MLHRSDFTVVESWCEHVSAKESIEREYFEIFNKAEKWKQSNNKRALRFSRKKVGCIKRREWLRFAGKRDVSRIPRY